MNILIVDDDNVSLMKMKAILSKTGDCQTASTGQSAISAFHNAIENGNPYDLVTLDIGLPDMDGMEVLFHIRDTESSNGLPETQVVMVTSHSDKGHIVTCLQAGCNEYVVKPFDQATVMKKIGKLIPAETTLESVCENKAPDKPDLKTRDEFKNKFPDILIVEDDPVSRKKLQAILRDLGNCSLAESAEIALSMFGDAVTSSRFFSLVALDIGLPDGSGSDVLKAIRKIEEDHNLPPENRSHVVMVTANSEKDQILDCVQAGCSGYIVKPFHRDMVFEKLGGLSRKTDDTPKRKQSSMIEEITRALSGGEVDLPTLPDINVKLKDLISKGADVDEVAALLKTDMAISARLIFLSNTPFYRTVSDCKTIEQAIKRLGLVTTRQQVEAICSRVLYEKTSPFFHKRANALWDHSLKTAYIAQFLVTISHVTIPHDAFTLGLMHDIGKMVLLRILDMMIEKQKFETPPSDTEIELTVSKHHGVFAEKMLGRWGFPKGYGEVARFHDNPDNAPLQTPSLNLVVMASLLASLMSKDHPDMTASDLAENPHALRIGLTASHFLEAMEKTTEAMASISENI